MTPCSCLGHLQNGSEAMADHLGAFVPHEQRHGAISLLKEAGILSPDGPEVRAVENVMKLIANSPYAAKVLPMAMETAWEAGPDKPALLKLESM